MATDVSQQIISKPLQAIHGQYNQGYIDRMVLSGKQILMDKGYKLAKRILNNEKCEDSICELNLLRWSIDGLSKYTPIGQKGNLKYGELFYFTFRPNFINEPQLNIILHLNGDEYNVINKSYVYDNTTTLDTFFKTIVNDINAGIEEAGLSHYFGALDVRSDYFYTPDIPPSLMWNYIVVYTKGVFSYDGSGCEVIMSGVYNYAEYPAFNKTNGFRLGIYYEVQSEECCITKEDADKYLNYLQKKYPVCCVSPNCDEAILQNYLGFVGMFEHLFLIAAQDE